MLQRFSCTLTKIVKSDLGFILSLKIPSKIILNLIIIEIVNLIKCLSISKDFSLLSICKRQTNYSLLRSPFVSKKSQEQLVFDRYVGNFSIKFLENSFLVSEYIEYFTTQSLKKICLLDFTLFKSLKTIGIC
jgi:hypothetical protein